MSPSTDKLTGDDLTLTVLAGALPMERRVKRLAIYGLDQKCFLRWIIKIVAIPDVCEIGRASWLIDRSVAGFLGFLVGYPARSNL